MQPSNKVGFLMMHLSFLLMRQNDQVLQERLGIGFSQFKILKVLEVQPHIQQKQIAVALGQTEASISRQIKLLHDKGLLRSAVRSDNRRQHITTLTPQGVQMAADAIKVLTEYHTPLFSQLTAAQTQQLLDILVTMHSYVCTTSGDGTCQQFLQK